MRRIAFALVVLSLCGSVAGREQISTPYSAADLAFATRPGTARIVGEARYRQADGAVVTPAENSPVLLIPKSRYTAAIMARIARAPTRRPDIANADQRVVATIRTTSVLAGGAFRFEGVPAGPYYLISSVTTHAPAGQERLLIKEVLVGEAQIVTVTLDS